MSTTCDLAKQLIERRSVTPADAGCQILIGQRLSAAGFSVQTIPFADVSNLYAKHGNGIPVLLFLGHTDVEPSGPEENWSFPPFEPTVQNGLLYGRGAADMKGPLAAMVTAAESFLERNPTHTGTIAFLLTSDEEGVAINGTAKVVQELLGRGEKIDYCLVGEPSSVDITGDTIKNGRRGSLTGKLTVKGVRGHVAYGERAINPIHKAAPALAELAAQTFDGGNEFFPATTLQISNIQAGTGADNVIPGHLDVIFNIRFSTRVTAAELQTRIESLLDKHNLDYRIDWRLSGQPFLTASGALLEATREAIKDILGIETKPSTAGGTSDGRFLAPHGVQVVELGPVNATIHKVDEHVKVEDLDRLSLVYERIAQSLLS